MKNIVSIIAICLLMIAPATAWIVTVDNITTTSIVWNVSNRTEAITALSYDGFNVSSYDPSALILIQDHLNPGEYHFMRIATNTTVGNATATTNASAQESYYSSSATVWGIIAKWFYLGLIIILLFLGLKLHWLFYWFASGVSLYAFAEYMMSNPVMVTDIWHIQFFIYGILFVLALLMWALRKKKGAW